MPEEKKLISYPIEPKSFWNDLRVRLMEDVFARFIYEKKIGKYIGILNPQNESSELTNEKILKIMKEMDIYYDECISLFDKDYIDNMNKILKLLVKKDKVIFEGKPVMWCKKCNTAIGEHDIHYAMTKIEFIYGKIKLTKGVFLVLKSSMDMFSNMIAVNINTNEKFVIVDVKKEKWILPQFLWNMLKMKMGLTEEVSEVILGSEVIKHIPEKSVTITKDTHLGSIPLAPKISRKHYEIIKNADIPTESKTKYFEPIIGEDIKIKAPHCKKCDDSVTSELKGDIYVKIDDPRKLLEYIEKVNIYPEMAEHILVSTARKKNIQISTLDSNMPTMPLLRCEKCGKLEVSKKNKKKCLNCKANMKYMDFRYNDTFLSAVFFNILEEKTAETYISGNNLINKLLLTITFMQLLDKVWLEWVYVLSAHKKIDFDEIYENTNPNVVRLSLVTSKIDEGYRKKWHRLVNAYSNVYNFYKINPEKQSSKKEIDNWILGRFQATKTEVNKNLKVGLVSLPLNILYDFIVNDLSRFYIKAVRNDKNVLDTLIPELSILLYPFLPGLTSDIYKSMKKEDISKDKNKAKDFKETSEDMDIVKKVVNSLLHFRNINSIPIRKPLGNVVFVVDEDHEHIIQDNIEIIDKLVNMPKFEIKLDDWDEMKLVIDPNREAIGKIYRQWVGKIAMLLHNRDAHKIKREIEKGKYKIGIEGQVIEIFPEMVNFKEEVPEGYKGISHDIGNIYVNVNESEEIQQQYLTNEIIRKIQYMRREIDLDYSDNIEIGIEADKDIISKIVKFKPAILEKTKATGLKYKVTTKEGYVMDWHIVIEWVINEKDVTIAIHPLFKQNVVKAFLNFPDMTKKRADSLFKAGYTTMEALMNANVDDIKDLEGFSESTAKSLLNEFEGIKEFKKTEVDGKYFCSLCGEELQEENYCSKCGTPIAKSVTKTDQESIKSKSKKIDVEKKSKKEAEGNSKKFEGIPKDFYDHGKKKEKSKKEKVTKIEFKSGFVYLVESDNLNKAFEMFKDLTEQDYKSFCISREYPDKVKMKYEISDDVEMVWLSNIGKKNSIRPKDLEHLSMHTEQFLADLGKIIFLDGIEFLITNNNFITILRFLQSLRDIISIENAMLIIPIDTGTLDANQISLIEKEVDKVIKV